MDSTQLALYNAVLSELLNPANRSVPEVSLDAVSYDGLAGADVTLEELAAQLGLGSPAQILDATVTVRDVLTAIADALLASGDPGEVSAATALATLALSTDPSLTVSLDDIFDIEDADADLAVGAPGAVGSASLNVADLVLAAAQAANGDNLLRLTVPPSQALMLAGVLGPIPVDLAVLESMRFAVGPAEQDADGGWVTTVSNAQLRLYLEVPVTDPAVLAALGVSELEVPVYVDAARADAALTAIWCDPARVAAVDPAALDEVDVQVDTSVVNVAVGTPPISPADVAVFPHDLLPGDITTLAGGVRVEALNPVTVPGTSQSLTFFPEYDHDNVQVVYAPDPASVTPVPVGSTVTDGLVFLNEATGQPVDPATQSTLMSVVGPVLDAVDGYAEQLANGLGITVGGADVVVNSLECPTTDPVLVE